MPTYKLYYFDVRGNGDVPRMIFAHADVAYEDVRVTIQQWPELKKGSHFRLQYFNFQFLQISRYVIWSDASTRCRRSRIDRSKCCYQSISCSAIWYQILPKCPVNRCCRIYLINFITIIVVVF
jgi:hypothetical protein